MTSAKRLRAAAEEPVDPLWYKDAIIYELHVRAFHDGNGDGIGDFQGLTEKLDYLRDLGVTTIWLLPFYTSPLRDDGYDIADFYRIHPAYGTLRDLKAFLAAAHARGLKVITELVLNHTSDQHPWFQRARLAPPGSALRNYYVWSDTAAEYASARIIFKDFERSNWTWDPVANQYFWHRFYSHQPDLNFDSPDVRREIFKITEFWLRLGVDGFRLDAVPYLFEREGTSCENLPETHAFLKELRGHIDERFPGRMLLAEANQWPEDAALYFGDGDECQMAYHFPLMPRLFMAVRMEDRYPITEILDQTPAIPETAQWALFLRNHDELTLEMVTDEERDYMYRVYASDDRSRINLGIRRRLSPLLGHNRRLIELVNALLLSVQGTPVIYYGDEIGMGDNIYLGDRDGVRTPMQWSADRNAGFSRSNPQRLFLPVIIDPEYHYESVNVDAQQANPSLLLWWMRRIIALRRGTKAFSRGTMAFIESDNRHVLSFVREFEDERILVVANLSRFTQGVHLELGGFAGAVPVEMFGRARFPQISSASRYFLSLGPHTFFWFRLEAVAEGQAERQRPALSLRVGEQWSNLLIDSRGRVEKALLAYLPERRWFASKARQAQRLTIADVIPMPPRSPVPAMLAILRVEYDRGEAEQYALVVATVSAEASHELDERAPWARIAPITVDGATTLHLVDGLALPEVATAFLNLFRSRTTLNGGVGTLKFASRPAMRALAPWSQPPSIHRGEQSNTSVVFGSSVLMKLVRRIEAGVHPQVELDAFLEETAFAGHAPRLAGTATYESAGRQTTVVVVEAMIAHQSDAWTLATDEIERFLEEAVSAKVPPPALPPNADPWSLPPPPEALVEGTAGWLRLAATIGQRTAELHAALISKPLNADFQPEPYNPFYQRALAQGFRAQARQSLRALRASLPALTDNARELAERVLADEHALLAQLQRVTTQPLTSPRGRCHGDLHLGQILVNGADVSFIDFEGEPARSLNERRIKRSVFVDVAGMVRSLHYASQFALKATSELVQGPAELELAADWARAWQLWSTHAFLVGYMQSAGAAGTLPPAPDEPRFLLDLFTLDKALYEVRYELDNRPGWVDIPLRGILDVLESAANYAAAHPQEAR